MKKAKSSFKGKVMKASQRQAQERSSYGYLNLPKGVGVFTAKPDTRVTLDFLPYMVTVNNHPDKDDENEIAMNGTEWYRRPYKIHRNVGATKDSVICLQSIGKKCPVCEYRQKRAKEGADKDELASLRVSDRYLYVINPLDAEGMEAGKFYVFDISHAMFQKLLDDEIDEGSVIEYFMDPVEGVSLRVRFTGKTIGNSKPFPEATKITPIDRKKTYPEDVATSTPKLDNLLIIMSYEELERKFFELEDETTPDKEEEPDEPLKPQRKPKKEVEPDEPTPQRKPKKTVATWPILEAMGLSQLTNYCKEWNLDIDGDDYEDDIVHECVL